MRLQELRLQLQQHLQTALLLLPDSVPLPNGVETRALIEKRAEKGQWIQVLRMMENCIKCNTFSPELHEGVSLARQAKNLHDSIIAQEMMKRTSDTDKQVISECLLALAHGPFVKDDGDLHSVTGLTREELALAAATWPFIETPPQEWTPDYEFPDFVSFCVYAAGQALTNILFNPFNIEVEWEQYIPTLEYRVKQVDKNWHELREQVYLEF